jgi:DNA-binding MarR family transcriptional regulator
MVYKFIKKYCEDTHKSPTIREIASGCFISVGSVIRHLDRLEIMQCIEREPDQARSIVLLDPKK